LQWLAGICGHQGYTAPVSFGQDVTSVLIVSHANLGWYLINLTTLQDIKALGIHVMMYVVNDKSIPRHRYLHHVTLNNYLEYGERLYADEKDEKELMREVLIR
jgi:hypothetical protein